MVNIRLVMREYKQHVKLMGVIKTSVTWRNFYQIFIFCK